MMKSEEHLLDLYLSTSAFGHFVFTAASPASVTAVSVTSSAARAVIPPSARAFIPASVTAVFHSFSVVSP